MTNKIYTKRIQKIAEFVTKKTIAEIGADHGYITKYLFLKNKINYAYLTDISSKSLDKAKNNLIKTYRDKTSFLVGDGLEVFKNKIVKKQIEIIIAGMGGKEIIKIMAKNEGFTNFILQPQKNVLELRQFLVNNNYKILKDEIVKSGNLYYFVLKVRKVMSQQKLTKNQMLFGLTNIKNFSQDFISYLNYQKLKNEQILKVKFVKDIYDNQIQIDRLLSKKGEKNV